MAKWRDVVGLLLNVRGATIGVYADPEEAERRAAELNADPYLEPDTQDLDAPYSAVRWVLS